LLEKLQKYKPKIAVFNGKLIFEVFSGKKDFSFGRQPEFVEGTNTVSLHTYTYGRNT
jgi:TDG/mug DNA glycosylase family protein